MGSTSWCWLGTHILALYELCHHVTQIAMHDGMQVTKGLSHRIWSDTENPGQFLHQKLPGVNSFLLTVQWESSVTNIQCWRHGVQKNLYLQNSIKVYFSLWFIGLFYLYNIEKCILWIGLVNINLICLLSDVNRTRKWTLYPISQLFLCNWMNLTVNLVQQFDANG